MDDKNSSTSGAPEATASSSRAHHAGDGGAVAGGPKRFSAKRKLAVVQRLLPGESLEAVSREENGPVHRLNQALKVGKQGRIALRQQPESAAFTAHPAVAAMACRALSAHARSSSGQSP